MHVILLRVAESGFAGYEDYTWIAFFAPAGTPRAVVRKLNSDVAAILRLPDTKERLAALGFDAVDNTPDEFAAYVKAEVIKWGKVIKDSGIGERSIQIEWVERVLSRPEKNRTG
ncbi:MAG: hypothetical protein A3F74_10835 [Betaproteobacteria bacterium RIFCSPLOWO2_12_FULL_62_58]|nr:MAG: hypothetical protein A3F74_10835 [Betaproteobacteria bacterium RIFCSPLOWO2_12_FULL_62_58]